ncbi:PilZ domain-containing protein [Solemya velesiana gill symbiont]|uniref:PilZ domain-containing protein n=1 Tax=Solemya velesiana gill symbiont TaxID=1918948 RepID=A0A1T2KWZ4_9GAMM|nr:PilZ domain-containing protein [Solemya velesiana gill symbiont]OOZ37324.1 hypothetical protein BOW51_02850 [Solemya velesiana gill symbiont]
MSIDRRYHQRIETNLTVQLIYRGRNFSAHACNITSHGLGLKTGYLTIPGGNLVELELRIGDRKQQIQGLVIHADKDNIGIMFRAPHTELEAVIKTHLVEQIRLSSPPTTQTSEPPQIL